MKGKLQDFRVAISFSNDWDSSMSVTFLIAYNMYVFRFRADHTSPKPLSLITLKQQIPSPQQFFKLKSAHCV